MFPTPWPATTKQPGPNSANPGYSPWIQPGSVHTTGSYNHYSALRAVEDLLGPSSTPSVTPNQRKARVRLGGTRLSFCPNDPAFLARFQHAVNL